MDDLAELKSRVLAFLKQGRAEEADKLMPQIMISPPDPAFLAEYARLLAGLMADEPGDASGE
ncbi:MAG: hypothetical protein KKA73_02930 [Chloroflexi bacterium]|nr:hypothetical protein [Chloroflexota bacterium]MBU1746618.1 hypothetical protein [Chloroflexota bacterium]